MLKFGFRTLDSNPSGSCRGHSDPIDVDASSQSKSWSKSVGKGRAGAKGSYSGETSKLVYQVLNSTKSETSQETQETPQTYRTDGSFIDNSFVC